MGSMRWAAIRWRRSPLRSWRHSELGRAGAWMAMATATVTAMEIEMAMAMVTMSVSKWGG